MTVVVVVVLMIIFWHYRMPFEALGCVSMLMNVTYVKILIEHDKSIDDCLNLISIWGIGGSKKFFSGGSKFEQVLSGEW